MLFDRLRELADDTPKKKLSEVQKRALQKLTSKPQCAYEVKERLDTLNLLVKLGYAKDVTPKGPGAMFSPTTHFMFVKK